MTKNRIAKLKRTTEETSIRLDLDLDGSGVARISTGLGFLDHMLTALAKHGRMDLELSCEGDLAVDDHHTAEDCALALGVAIDQALGERHGINRFGWALAPLDEALAQVAIDFSGRPYAHVALGFERPTIGRMATENLTHVLASLATAARATLHVDLIRGANDHHKAEAAFKALALALRHAVTRSGFDDIPSTKGTLSGSGA